jgi:hypothetical protein
MDCETLHWKAKKGNETLQQIKNSNFECIRVCTRSMVQTEGGGREAGFRSPTCGMDLLEKIVEVWTSREEFVVRHVEIQNQRERSGSTPLASIVDE